MERSSVTNTSRPFNGTIILRWTWHKGRATSIKISWLHCLSALARWCTLPPVLQETVNIHPSIHTSIDSCAYKDLWRCSEHCLVHRSVHLPGTFARLPGSSSLIQSCCTQVTRKSSTVVMLTVENKKSWPVSVTRSFLLSVSYVISFYLYAN